MLKVMRLSFLPAVVLLIALGITCSVWRHERLATHQQVHAQFDFALREAVSRIEQRVAAYEQMLRGVQSLYATTDIENRAHFHEYVDALQLDANFSGVQFIGIAKPALASVSVIQVEPDLVQSPSGPGLDVWPNPVLRSAMELARDSGKVAMSAKVAPRADSATDASDGFLVFLPVFAKGKPRDTVGSRRENLVGWVFASIAMQDMMASLYGEQSPGLLLQVHDGVEPSDAMLLYRSAAPVVPAEQYLYSAKEYMVFAGHTWTLSLAAGNDFETRFARDAATRIAVAGISLSLLLALLAWLLTNGRDRALRLAAEMTRDLRESEKNFQSLFEASPDAIVVVGKGVIQAVNQQAERLFGYQQGELTGRSVEVLIPAQYRSGHVELRQAYSQDPHLRMMGQNRDLLALRKDGTEFPIDINLSPISTAGGVVVISSIRDITERKRLEDEVLHLAFYDSLTKLANRRLLNDRLTQAIVRARREQSRFALLFIDLDKLKPINDAYGHGVGDWLLQSFARRLESCLRASDTAARFGGDEFVVLMPDLQTSADALGVAEKIRAVLEQPLMDANGVAFSVSSSIGVALYPDHGETEQDLLRLGDGAMYQAKKAGGNNVQMAAQG
jgi:diguanylate cyclase (GGDEF)-like protein/PAS domain S-box-containing protein